MRALPNLAFATPARPRRRQRRRCVVEHGARQTMTEVCLLLAVDASSNRIQGSVDARQRDIRVTGGRCVMCGRSVVNQRSEGLNEQHLLLKSHTYPREGVFKPSGSRAQSVEWIILAGSVRTCSRFLTKPVSAVRRPRMPMRLFSCISRPKNRGERCRARPAPAPCSRPPSEPPAPFSSALLHQNVHLFYTT